MIRTHIVIKCMLCLFLVSGYGFSGYGQQSTADSALQSIMDKYEAVGMAVAVVKNNELIYNHSFGFKHLADQTPLQNDDIFRIASISKSFTVTAIMQLVAAGKLSLDEEVGGLVGFEVRHPKFPDIPITLRMVLSHTSSISDKNGYFVLDVINPNKNPQWADSYNDYAPGEGYKYCNLNFNLAGTILERASGQRFDQYVKEHVLDPLQLYGGYCVDSLDHERFATLYSYSDSTARFEPSPAAYASHSEEIRHYTMGYSTPIFSPTGGMKISALDLAKYMMMHMNYGTYGDVTLISEANAKTMQTPISEKSGYGLAIGTQTQWVPGKTLKGHTGNAYGLFSAMFFHPEEKFGFVVITNGYRATPTQGSNDFLRECIVSLYTSFIK